jgi:hypothetical protein
VHVIVPDGNENVFIAFPRFDGKASGEINMGYVSCGDYFDIDIGQGIAIVTYSIDSNGGRHRG